MTAGQGGLLSEQEAAKAALSYLQIANVHPTALSAELKPDVGGTPQGARYGVELQYLSAPGLFENLVRYQIAVLNEEEVAIAEVAFTLSIEFSVEGEYEVPDPAAEFITRTTSYFAAYPYAREIAQMLATRLQISPMVLGLLHHGSLDPTGIGIVSTQRD